MEIINSTSLKSTLLTNSYNSGDINSPLSYLEWKRMHIGVSEETSNEQYNSYVLQWFSNHKQKTISSQFILRQKYLYLLDQLQLFFSEEEKYKWYNQINFADDRELLLAIPFFAKRLKEISLYYLNLRKKLKNSKVKYNLVGSAKGLEQEIYTFLLENFALSGKNAEHNPSVQLNLPSFSNLRNRLTVNIEELYDNKNYFDISSTQPLSSYFNFLHASTSEYLATKGIVLSSADWAFRLFDSSITDSTFSTTFNDITSVLFEATDADTYTQFIQKYISESKYTTSYFPELTTTNVYTVSLGEGDNYFFYPYGTNSSTFSINQILPTIALSSITINGATAGDHPSNSDTIIVKYKDATKAAWLRQIDYIDSNENVEATIKRNASTFFIFPYPGYGLSGQDVEWTGSSFETNPEYNFLTAELKSAVNEAYWAQSLPADTCDPILLNNTTLVLNGAIPNKDPRFADQFYIRTDRDTDTLLPRGDAIGAWLYKITETSLPVSTVSDNVYLWPYTRINLDENFPSHLNDINFAKACNNVSIQDIPTSYFIAASSIDLADKIYKVSYYQDDASLALECAWLSGESVDIADYARSYEEGLDTFSNGEVNGYRYVKQDGFTGLFTAGEAVKFIWSQPVTVDSYQYAIGTSLEDVFKTFSHKSDCPYVTNIPKTHNLDWQNCTCKQVYHTPFGHTQSSFAAGNYFADCIFEVANQEIDSFDFGSWRDTYGRSLTDGGSNIKFAWYKTSTSNSWGGGKWVTDSGQSPFKLMPGKCYVYIRANTKTSSSAHPSYAVQYSFNSKRTTWIEAKKDPVEGTWISTGNTSLMEIFPGDFIKIERQLKTTHYVLSATSVETSLQNNKSIWSTYDTIPVNCQTISNVNISWPKDTKPFGSTDSQYPPFNFSELARVEAWSIQREEDGVMEYYKNPTQYEQTTNTNTVQFTLPLVMTTTDLFSGGVTSFAVSAENINTYNNIFDSVLFASPTTIGTYIISVTARKTDDSLVVLSSSTIPPITCVPQFLTNQHTSIAFETPSCGFLLEKRLKGWNYNKNKIDTLAEGARPYWAVLTTTKDQTTRYKSMYSWGYPNEYIDDYLPDNTPRISPIEITYGSTIQYDRKGQFLAWNQPIYFRKYAGTSQWCILSADYNQPSNFYSLYDIRKQIDPIGLARTEPTDILLSNYIEGDPLEVYYNATNSVTWDIEYQTVQSQDPAPLSAFYVAKSPWQNLTNRFNPSIAALPVLDEAYSLKDVGGYFLPQNLGASQFINRNFSVFIDTEKLTGTSITEDPNIHVGGRGFTQEEQPTVFDWTEDNQWLKESVTAGESAGSIKKSLTKILQTFVPYQSNISETALGLVTTHTKLSPWGGVGDSEWIDPYFDTSSFTGIRSVSAWANSQVIKEAKKDVESWTSDIYGNQYSIFKDLTDIPFHEHAQVGGDMWVKLNNQITLPATKVLSKTFESLAGLLPEKAYNDLYSGNIQIVNCYFNTLFIKTPSVALFVKLLFDYETQEIQTVFDDTRWILLNENVKFEKNWFFSTNKKVIILTTKFEKVGLNSLFYPCLYELDLSTTALLKVFEIRATDTQTQTLTIKDKLDCAFTYDKGHNRFLITYSGINVADNKMFFLDYYVSNDSVCRLQSCALYQDSIDLNQIAVPPLVSYHYLTAVNITANSSFAINIPASNYPNRISILNNSSVVGSISANTLVTFTGKLTAGTYNINYKLENNAGESIYCLTLYTAS